MVKQNNQFSKLKVIFRADGSNKIGLGDVTTCLTLAQKIQERMNVDISFLMRNFQEGIEKVVQKGLSVKKIPQQASFEEELELTLKYIEETKADLVITEAPRMNVDYLRRIKDTGVALGSIDFEGGVECLSDIVINWDLVPERHRYIRLNNETKFLLGTSYVILSEDFQKAHQRDRFINQEVKNILITLGGSDPLNLSSKVIKGIERINYSGNVVLVIGSAYKYHRELGEILDQARGYYDVRNNVDNMAELMMRSDIAIATGGVTSFELAATGTPVILLCAAEHQIERAMIMEKLGMCISLGYNQDISEEEIGLAILRLMEDKELRQRMSIAGKKLVDGRGTERVVNEIMTVCKKKGFQRCFK